MSLLSNLFSAIRPSGLIQALQTSWTSLTAFTPHLALLAGVISLAWRATLVAEPAGAFIFFPKPYAALPSDSVELVVVSANLKHDFPRFRDMEARLEAFAQLVEEQGADVLLLQEVSRTKSFKVDEWLRDRLGMGYVYGRANGHMEGIGFEEGVAIFSRFPITDPEVRELSSGKNPFTRRVGINASILLPNGKVEAFSVHLGIASGGNQQQIHALQNWASTYSDTATVIIGGDFNAENQTPRIQSIQSVWTDTYLAAGPDEEPTTHILETPWGLALREHRLDYIFLAAGPSGWEASATNHLETKNIQHSDHKVVVAELIHRP